MSVIRSQNNVFGIGYMVLFQLQGRDEANFKLFLKSPHSNSIFAENNSLILRFSLIYIFVDFF